MLVVISESSCIRIDFVHSKQGVSKYRIKFKEFLRKIFFTNSDFILASLSPVDSLAHSPVHGPCGQRLERACSKKRKQTTGVVAAGRGQQPWRRRSSRVTRRGACARAKSGRARCQRAREEPPPSGQASMRRRRVRGEDHLGTLARIVGY